GTFALAGYGMGVRLEYLLIPLVFGFGSALVTMVGTNFGAGQRARAGRVAWTGAAMAAGATEAIGLAAAFFPHSWLGLFTNEPAVLAAGAAYLRVVGPAYGFFGLGLALYFASQGAGRLLWPSHAVRYNGLPDPRLSPGEAREARRRHAHPRSEIDSRVRAQGRSARLRVPLVVRDPARPVSAARRRRRRHLQHPPGHGHRG